MTAFDLQVEIAEYAHELIKYVPFNMEGDQEEEAYFYWLSDGKIVTSHEWDYLVWYLINRDITDDVLSSEADGRCQLYHTKLEDTLVALNKAYTPHLKLNPGWRARATAYIAVMNHKHE